jgi:hypothetical protein
MLGARVDSMSDRLCHCRARSSAGVRDDQIPDRIVRVVGLLTVCGALED